MNKEEKKIEELNKQIKKYGKIENGFYIGVWLSLVALVLTFIVPDLIPFELIWPAGLVASIPTSIISSIVCVFSSEFVNSKKKKLEDKKNLLECEIKKERLNEKIDKSDYSNDSKVMLKKLVNDTIMLDSLEIILGSNKDDIVSENLNYSDSSLLEERDETKEKAHVKKLGKRK